MDARILIVEDEPATSTAMRRLLREHGAFVTVADTLAAGLATIRCERWDVVIVDLRLGDGDGGDVVTEVSEISPGTGIVVCSGYLTPERSVALQRLGAVVYEKGCDGQAAVLVQAIRAALTRARSDWRRRARVGTFARTHGLSDREDGVLRRALGGMVRNKEIAAAMGVSESSVQTYWARIQRKCGCRGKTELFRRIALFEVAGTETGTARWRRS